VSIDYTVVVVIFFDLTSFADASLVRSLEIQGQPTQPPTSLPTSSPTPRTQQLQASNPPTAPPTQSPTMTPTVSDLTSDCLQYIFSFVEDG
jgi:cell division septation protein DedD